MFVVNEPEEDNPMIGWRGASRYYHKNYQQAFELECRAFNKVRNQLFKIKKLRPTFHKADVVN